MYSFKSGHEPLSQQNDIFLESKERFARVTYYSKIVTYNTADNVININQWIHAKSFVRNPKFK